MFWCVSYHLGAFGTVWLPYETRCKTVRANAIVCATKSHWNFCNESTRSTSLDPKLMFWWVSYYLGAFGTVWLPHKTRCKTGRTSAKVGSMKSHWNFRNERTWSIPLDPELMFWCVLSVWVHLGPFRYCMKIRQTGAINAKVRATKSCWNFSQRMLPIHTIRP